MRCGVAEASGNARRRARRTECNQQFRDKPLRGRQFGSAWYRPRGLAKFLGNFVLREPYWKHPAGISWPGNALGTDGERAASGMQFRR